MSALNSMTKRKRARHGNPQVGFFGLLGSGNLGNDGSLDAMVHFLTERHPGARLSFFCSGPTQIAARYGAEAIPLEWYGAHGGSAAGARANLLKVIGKLLDPFRTLAWVRRNDTVVVAGMGMLETTVPLRPWAIPYSLLMLCLTARVCGTKVALVSVGANFMRQRLTRSLFTGAARLAHYRSYRDAPSMEAARAMGVGVASDTVYPDLAFALPAPPARDRTAGVVGIGLMNYRGSNDDRYRADDLHHTYLATMIRLVRWLVDEGKQVRLFTGDKEDLSVVDAILTDLRENRPDLDPSTISAEPPSTQHELMQLMSEVECVIATRYHNVLCALRLATPTLSLGYATKNDVLMGNMGLGDFCQQANEIDFEQLIEQFKLLHRRGRRLTETMIRQNTVVSERLEEQFEILDRMFFSASDQTTAYEGAI